MTETPRLPEPTPLSKTLGFWLVRVAIMTAIVSLWQTYLEPKAWLWIALLGYALVSLTLSLVLERYRNRGIAEINALLDQEKQ